MKTSEAAALFANPLQLSERQQAIAFARTRGPAPSHAVWRKPRESADSLEFECSASGDSCPTRHDPQVWNPRRLTGGDLEVKK